MLIFHEGLPGSGKSLGAMKDHIIPALQTGRKVIAYLEGLNHEKIAEVAEIDLEKCKQLLRPITREEVLILPTLDYTDALVVIDELQNFWPAGRTTLPDDVIQFVTEHRHRGADILAMGQCLTDCHAMWRRRVARKYHFIQRDAVGKPDEYTVIVQKGVPDGRRGDIKFEEIAREKHKYDPKYFGTYASHVQDAENKETLMDQRAVIWNNPMFKRWIPLFGIGVLFAVGYLVHFFTGTGVVTDTKKKEPVKASAPAPKPRADDCKLNGTCPQQQAKQAVSAPAPASSASVSKLDGPDLVKSLSDKAVPRLAGLVFRKGVYTGRIAWHDQSGALVHAMSFDDLAALGYSVMVNAPGTLAIMRRGDYAIPASSFVQPVALK